MKINMALRFTLAAVVVVLLLVVFGTTGWQSGYAARIYGVRPIQGIAVGIAVMAIGMAAVPPRWYGASVTLVFMGLSIMLGGYWAGGIFH